MTLKGWQKFRGGLDIRGNMTGEDSMYTTHEEHEIMFHVSTMLPFSAEDSQQVRLNIFHFKNFNSKDILGYDCKFK